MDSYGQDDVVGCGVLFNTKTFIFTLNEQLVGSVAARDVDDLDVFREADDEDTEEGWAKVKITSCASVEFRQIRPHVYTLREVSYPALLRQVFGAS